MSAPRLQIDLDKIHHNASSLVVQLAERGISVTGITKATLGSPAIAATLLRAGVRSIGDSRIENLERVRTTGQQGSKLLIRSPMISQASRVVATASTSLNTELSVIRQLSLAAQTLGQTHSVILMIELGDLREGIMAKDLEPFVAATLRLPNIRLAGLGTNLACRKGITPDAANMGELSSLVTRIENKFGIDLGTVSGGNSANLAWALSGADIGRVNNLRLGESILLGREPLHRQPLAGLHTDAITLTAEVIESKTKPSQAWGVPAEATFGKVEETANRGLVAQAILAVGRQDVDEQGLRAPDGIEVVAASSDHLVVYSDGPPLTVGDEVAFELNYSALLRAMTSPFVAQVTRGANPNKMIPAR